MADAYATFQNIYEAVIRDAKESTAVTAVVDSVKRWINEGYEVVNFRKKRTYLDTRFVYSLKGKVDSTFTVTSGSSIVVHVGTSTLLTSGLDLGLKASGFEETYEVSSITGTLVVLTTSFKGTTGSATAGVLYQKGIYLDTSISEVYQAWHDYYRSPLENIGPMRMRKNQLYYPEQYAKPTQFAIFGEDTSNTKRRLSVWPFPDEDMTLNVDANIFPTEMSLSTDVPLIPSQYRQILYWYALSKLFGTFNRNTEREQVCIGNFNTWLAKLDGEDQVSQDYSRLLIDYRQQRRMIRGRAFDPRLRDDP